MSAVSSQKDDGGVSCIKSLTGYPTETIGQSSQRVLATRMAEAIHSSITHQSRTNIVQAGDWTESFPAIGVSTT
jgi:hypothetical protein